MRDSRVDAGLDATLDTRSVMSKILFAICLRREESAVLSAFRCSEN